jgi:tetratricopeptide (TPR) repeat protein
MSESPNKLIRFWQELKRRKVFKVTAMYAGTAFIILQLIDIIAQPLKLPAWTMTLVIVLLCIGFIITLLIAWIYDITPEGIRKTESIEESKEKVSVTIPMKRRIKVSDIIIAAMAIVIMILLYPKVFNKDKLKDIKDPDGRISIAVTDFDDLTSDTTLIWLKKGIPELLRNNLTGTKELLLQNSQTMFELYESMGQTQTASVVSSLSREAAIKLKSGTYITGSFQKYGNNILTLVKLIDTKSDEVLWTGKIDGTLGKYTFLIDSLSAQLKNFLEIKALIQRTRQDYNEVNTNSAEALRKYIAGMKAIINGDYLIAAKTLEESYRIDTTFTLAAFFCSFAYCYFDHRQAGYWERIAYPYKEKLTEDYRMWLEFWHGWFTTKNTNEILSYCSSIEKSGTKSRFILFDIGCAYTYLGKPDKSISMFEKAEKVSSEWGEDWKYRDFYKYFSDACHIAGKSDKEVKVLEIGLKLFPDDNELIWRQARLALSTINTKRTKELIDKYEYLCNRSGESESEIKANIGLLYGEVDSLDRAEKYFRQALSLESENPYRLNNLAWFLIDNDQNIKEGLELIDKALDLKPDDYNYMDTKGWGLYKQGKFMEAREILQKSWDMSPSYSSHSIYLHLEAAKKAVAGLKR